MPELEYWISGTALFLGASCCFACCVAVFAIREMISERGFRILMLAAIFFGLFGWKTAAQQEKESAALKADVRAIADRLKISQGSQSASELAAEILKRLPPKYPLTDSEKESLGNVLRQYPIDERFHVDVFWPQLNGTSQYAAIVAKIFENAGWDVAIKQAGLANAHGLVFAVSQNTIENKIDMPPEAKKLMEILSSAGVPWAKGTTNNTPDGIFAFIVGEPTLPP